MYTSTQHPEPFKSSLKSPTVEKEQTFHGTSLSIAPPKKDKIWISKTAIYPEFRNHEFLLVADKQNVNLPVTPRNGFRWGASGIATHAIVVIAAGGDHSIIKRSGYAA